MLFGALFVGSFAVLQRSVFGKETAEYTAIFPDAGGLTTGAKVLMSGVQIGQVKSVELASPGEARAVLAIHSDQQIPRGSTALLPASLISLGEKEVQIIPPASIAGYLQPGDSLAGSLGGPLDSFFPDSAETVRELNATLAALRKVVEDAELRDSLVGVMESSEKTIENFGMLAGRVDGLLARNQSNIDTMVRSVALSLENLQVVSEKVRDLAASGDLEARTMTLLDNMNSAVAAGKQLVEELDAMASDPEMRGALKSTMANVSTMSESGTKIAKNAETIAENAVTMSAEGAELMKKANVLADEVKTLLESFRKTVDKFQSPSGKLFPEMEMEAGLTHQTEPGHYRADFNLTWPMGQEKITFGLYDAFESNKLNLQLVKPLGDRLDLRYGVYASKPSVGVDYAFAPRLGLRSDLFGLNDPQFDLRLRFDFGNGLLGWAGVERLFDRNAPSIGVGIKR